MKNILLLLFCGVSLYAQTHFNPGDPMYFKQTYIMQGVPQINKCDVNGTPSTTDQFSTVNAQYNSTFIVVKKITVSGEVSYVIKFNKYKLNDANNKRKALKYNYIVSPETYTALTTKTVTTEGTSTTQAIAPDKNDIRNLNDDAYFLISEDNLTEYGLIYEPLPFGEFSYGTIAYLARLRPGVGDVNGRCSTDLSLGLAAGVRFNINKNHAINILGGLAISKISLDSLSTRGAVSSTTEKPALTPNLNVMYSYKNFSLGMGIGMDWINEETKESKAWIYNNKPFYGLIIGLNVFSRNTEGTTNESDQEQN